MDYKLLGADSPRTFVLVGGIGDDPIDALSAFARRERIGAAQITGVGAFQQATVGWFDRDAREYRRIPVQQQCELLSLVGDIALRPDGSPAVHVHAVLGLADGQVRGGHLLAGSVWPTLEVVIREAPSHLRKTYRPDLGLALIDLGGSDSGESA